MIPSEEEIKGIKYVGFKRKIRRTNINGKITKKRKTKRLELVKLCNSFFKFFLSKMDFSNLENILTISPPVLLTRVRVVVMYLASSNFTRS